MALFEIRNLTFTYPEAKTPALQEVNVAIEQGEFIVICGKSGCGKTTLLRHFKTALTPYGTRSGEIRFLGDALEQVSVRTQASEIGYVLQSPDNQIVTDKVWHEMAFGLENLGYDQQTIRLRVAEMASFFGIQNWFAKNVEELSGGQKQLLNLASVMAMQPKVLVLDEPTSQLDPIAASEFLATIRKINLELGTTVIIIEHRLEEVFPMADKVLVLEEGRQILYDEPRQVGKALAGNDLFLAMPSPVQIYDGTGQVGTCPLTVCEGRNWLKAHFEKEQSGFCETENEKRTAWDRVETARSKKRLTALDYMETVFDGFWELHGDRLFGDDPAIMGGLALLDGQPVTVIGIQKGRTTKENLARNFGMPSPDGYRKALRLMKQAETFGRPVICFVDTPGAFCGLEAEERGQGEAIARNLFEMSDLKVPILSIVIGEGGSGGALAMAVADQVWMMENAIYSILSPEGFASILWKDSKKAPEAAKYMKITASDLYERGLIERIIPEGENFSLDELPSAAACMDEAMAEFFENLEGEDGQVLAENRYQRFRRI